MSIDPHVALQSLMAALEEHLTAASQRRGDKDPLVERAYLAVADAFEVYEEVLYDAYGEVTPLEIYEDDDDEFDGGFAEDSEGADERSSGVQPGQ
ncbi:hypothetical protein ACFFON_05155 [Arthrobacter citreus]|uniref:hypothetical protein n=1 Tax=Arthrobacter TaxID=1663 RepID=UPI001263E8EE|nr:hypothetical protein [Arthrobacter gandavensis]